MPSLRVLFLAAEAEPFIKIGGLGEVAGSLSRALHALTNPNSLEVDIRLVLPYYGAIQQLGLPLKRETTFLVRTASGKKMEVESFSIISDGLKVYLISGGLIQTDRPVYTDDLLADGKVFGFFSLAALELVRNINWSPHIIHANDWHTSLAIYALNLWRRKDFFFDLTGSILGLHNLPYMGVSLGEFLMEYNLPPLDDMYLPPKFRDVPLPIALATADYIVPVSPSYAQEILTHEFGAGLHDYLRTRKQRIKGILNGLDTEYWNPKSDTNIRANFDEQHLSARIENKLTLQRELGLEEDKKIPILGIVSRLDWQKGIDLVPQVIRNLNRAPSPAKFQAVILGTGDVYLEQMILSLSLEFPDQVKAINRFDANLSHRIYAGVDILLVPSRYEPCGLTQMIAMRYGCVPVGRKTGGLQDTIQDYDQSLDSTGFLFDEPSAFALEKAIHRAIRLYDTNTQSWQELQKRGMNRDYSWQQSAHQYLDLYLDLASKVDPVFQLERIVMYG